MMAAPFVAIPDFMSRAEPVGWVKDNVRIPPDKSSRPGPLILEAWQREPFIKCVTPGTEDIVLMAASQTGKSTIIQATLCWYVGQEPTSVLLTQPDLKGMGDFYTAKVEPLFSYSPNIAEKIDRRTLNKMIKAPSLIRHAGGEIHTDYSGSKSFGASKTVRVVLADEVDRYRATARGTTPLSDLRQRVETFREAGMAKVVIASTPEDVESSLIYSQYMAGSQAQWYVKCVHCGYSHTLEWENVNTESRVISCPDCGTVLTEDERRKMIDGGSWVHNKPELLDKRASYHISRLASTLASIERIVEDSPVADVTRSWRDFSTLVLGWPWDFEGAGMDMTDEQAARCLVDECPWDKKDLDAVTVGVDVHKDRLEASVVWWQGMMPHVHSHTRFDISDSGSSEAWRELAEFLRKGDRPDMTFVDGGYMPDDVMGNLKRHWGRVRYRMIKGAAGDSFNKPLILSPSTRYTGENAERHERARALMIAPDQAKMLAFQYVENGELTVCRPNVRVGWHERFNSEQLIEKTTANGRVGGIQWHQRRARNEELDCFVYALAARQLLENKSPVSFSRRTRGGIGRGSIPTLDKSGVDTV